MKKNLILNTLIGAIAFFMIYANAENNRGRWSIGLIHNIATLSTNEVETPHGIRNTGGSNDVISFKTSSFSGNGLSIGYKNKINQNWLSQELLWETNIFLGIFSDKKNCGIRCTLYGRFFSKFFFKFFFL